MLFIKEEEEEVSMFWRLRVNMVLRNIYFSFQIFIEVFLSMEECGFLRFELSLCVFKRLL